MLFVAGCEENQVRFHPRFDLIILLSAPAEVLLTRIAERSGNPYGKRPDERALILEHLAVVEPLLRATATLEDGRHQSLRAPEIRIDSASASWMGSNLNFSASGSGSALGSMRTRRRSAIA